MCTKFTCKYIQNFLTYPSTFCECCKCKIIWIYFTKTCNEKKRKRKKIVCKKKFVLCFLILKGLKIISWLSDNFLRCKEGREKRYVNFLTKYQATPLMIHLFFFSFQERILLTIVWMWILHFQVKKSISHFHLIQSKYQNFLIRIQVKFRCFRSWKVINTFSTSLTYSSASILYSFSFLKL